MIRRSLIYFLLVIPALVYVVILSFIPAATVVFDSFQTPTKHYVLSNYIAISNAGLGNSIIDTLFVSIGALLLQLVIAIFIANIMSKPFRGNKAFSVATIIPFGVSTIVADFIFYIIFSAVGGFANSFLHLFGIHQVDWYQNSIYEMAVVIFSDHWKNTPLVALVIFSGLTSNKYSIMDYQWPGSVNQTALGMNTSKTNSVLNVSLQAMKEGVFLRDPVQWISEWQNLIDSAWTQILVDHGNYSKIPSILSSENSSMYSYLLSTYNYTVAYNYEIGHYKPISV